MEFFITDGPKTIGPFSKEELKLRNISGNTLVFTDETNWVEAKTIPALADVIRRVPPPPPKPKVETVKEEPVYHAASQTASPQKSNKGWLYGLLIAAGITGGGTVFYQQQQQTDRLQDEIRSRNMQAQEEQARAERERKRAEIEAEKQRLRSEIADFETELSVLNDKLSKAQEWQLLRSAEERETQIRNINTNMRSIEEAIRDRREKVAELANAVY